MNLLDIIVIWKLFGMTQLTGILLELELEVPWLRTKRRSFCGGAKRPHLQKRYF